MLPDIPATKKLIQKQLRRRFRDQIRAKNVFLQMVDSITQHEGQSHQYEQEGGVIVSEGFKEFAAPIEIKFDEVPNLVGKVLTDKIDAAAEKIARDTHDLAIEKITAAANHAGTAVNAGGRPFSQELYLDSLSRLEMSFDEKGNPTTALVAGPQLVEIMKQRLDEWQNDRPFKKKFEEIMQSKREAWRDRESRRKLVD